MTVPTAQIVPIRRPPAPPYVGFEAVKSLLRSFAGTGVPRPIEQVDIPGSSAVQASQIITSLRFLGLVDDGNLPLPPMLDLVQAIGTRNWPFQLEMVLRGAYRALFERDLSVQTYEEFVEWFSLTYPGADDVQRKSRAFFVRAALDANIEIARAIIGSIKPRYANSGRSHGNPRSYRGADGVAVPERPGREAASRKLPRLSAQLTGAFPDFAQLSLREREAVRVTISLLMERGR